MRLFLPEKTLEDWAISEVADLSDGHLIVRETQSKYLLVSALYFSNLASGDDTHNLLGRVKSLDQLAHLNPEHMADSCLIGETAYETNPGYVIEVVAQVPTKAEPKKKTASPEADLLAAFILDKL
jgi:hypothetical protein